MKKYLILFLLVSIVFSMASCGGGGAGSSSSPPGEDPNVPFLIELRPSQSIAQTNTFIYIRARVLNGNGNPIPNIPVTFTNLSSIGELNYAKGSSIHHALTFLAKLFSVGGLISTGANTDTNGFATVKLYSTTSGFATIQAEVNTGTGQVRDKKTVYFSLFDMTLPSPPAPPAPTLALDVDTDGLFNTPNEQSDFKLFETANDNQVFVRATVFDSNGTPVSGSVVTFGADSTEATFPLGNTKTTDANGRASVLVQVDPIILRTATTVLNITASADNGAAGMITLFLQPVVVNTTTSYLTANPTTVQPSGTSAILAVIMLNTGSPAPDGTAVTFTTTCGSVTPFGQTTGGVATATFTAPSIPGTCTVTGRVGGTTIGTAAITVSKTLTVIPTTRTIANPVVGNTATYTILGGTSPYQAFSSNPGVATAVAGSVLTATVASVPTTDTTVTFTIYDSVGDSVTASLVLDVPPALPLTVIPTTQTISNPVVGNSRAYTIIGGTSPYTAFSNNPALATVSVAGSTLTATVASVPTTDTTVTITIYDSVGANVSASLVLDVPPTLPLAVIPTTQTKSNPTAGQTAEYKVLGGAGGYSAYSSSPSLVSVPVVVPATNIVTATLQAGVSSLTADTTVTITIYDSVGANVSASLVLDVPPTLPLAVIPTTQTISSPAVSNSRTYTIIGGTGSYSAFSDNPGLATVLVAGSTLTAIVAGVPTTDTTVTITIYDSVGANVSASLILDVVPTIALTVTPASITVTGTSDATDSVTFYISGGSGTYPTVVSSNTAVVPNPVIANPFTINPAVVATSTAVTLTVADSLGATGTATVTVTPATSTIALNPSSITVDPTVGTITFNIIGGVSTFDVFTSDIAVVTVGGGVKIDNLAVNTFDAQVVGSGSATITVVDSDAKTVTATVTVTELPAPPPPPALTVLPPSGVLSCTAGGTVTFVVTGGAGPNYLATSSNPNVVIAGSPVTTSGGSFTATVAAASCGLFPSATTTVPIIVTDSGSGITTVTVTVNNP
jgi:hypothetical protein